MTAFLYLRLLNRLGPLVQLLRFLAALQYYVHACGLLLYTEYGGLSRSDPQLVCLSVCHDGEPRENSWTNWGTLLGEEGRVDSGGPKEACIRWGSRSPCKMAILRQGMAHCKVWGLSAVSCAFGCTRCSLRCWGPGNHLSDGGAHWRQLATVRVPRRCCLMSHCFCFHYFFTFVLF